MYTHTHTHPHTHTVSGDGGVADWDIYICISVRAVIGVWAYACIHPRVLSELATAAEVSVAYSDGPC